MPTARIRKSGNSTVIVIPPELLREKNMKVGQEVSYDLYRKVNLGKLFGRSKKLKITGQQAKDMLRKEW